MEEELAYLYSIFVGRPYTVLAMQEWGKGGRIYRDRIRILETAAEQYFLAKPDQTHEGAFLEIVKAANRLSAYRHQIAHGAQVSLPVYEEDEAQPGNWIGPTFRSFLWPPWYAKKRLPFDEDAIDSRNIASYASEFTELREQAAALATCLAPRP
jgi:hypothetical protein